MMNKMGILFDDANEVICPECNSPYFYERVEYMIDKNETALDTTYIETERRYAIRCAKCNKLIDSNMSPKLVPRR